MLADPAIGTNVAKLREIGKERSGLEDLATAAAELERLEKSMLGAKELAAGADGELRELAEAEVAELTGAIEAQEDLVRTLSIPKDPDDSRDAIVEVRAGTGGDEAALFAAEMVRMYLRFADRNGWKTEMLEQNSTEIGGVKEAVFSLQGNGAYGTMRYESGVHRVQRVPQTESGGRIHTQRGDGRGAARSGRSRRADQSRRICASTSIAARAPADRA